MKPIACASLIALQSVVSLAAAALLGSTAAASPCASGGSVQTPVSVGTSGGSYSASSSPLVYCTAKVNSQGCLPSIGWMGAPSASAGSGFFVTAVNERNNKLGQLLYSVNGAAALPFNGGILCVKPQIKKACILNSGGTPPPINDCSGIYAIDMNQFATGSMNCNVPSPALLVMGTTVYCQWWAKDGASSFGTSLSDALMYVVGP